MKRHWRPLAFVVTFAAIRTFGEASAQGTRRVIVTQGTSVIEAPAVVVPSAPVVTTRPRRLRNRYFARRPVYAQPRPGARASVTFENFTSKYYPNENTYYPAPAVRP